MMGTRRSLLVHMGNHGFDFTEFSTVFSWAFASIFIDSVHASGTILKKYSYYKKIREIELFQYNSRLGKNNFAIFNSHQICQTHFKTKKNTNLAHMIHTIIDICCTIFASKSKFTFASVMCKMINTFSAILAWAKFRSGAIRNFGLAEFSRISIGALALVRSNFIYREKAKYFIGAG